jgi:leucyl-tRNA synthetase
VRFLQNVWRVVEEPKPTDGDPHVKLRHKTIRSVTERIEALKFNTAIAAMMEYVSVLNAKGASRADQNALVHLASPFAPHLAEEAWERLGHGEMVCRAEWPSYEEALTIDDTRTVAVQVSGKMRGTVDVPRGAEESVVREAAEKVDAVARAMAGKSVVKVVFVKDRMMNLVVK